MGVDISKHTFPAQNRSWMLGENDVITSIELRSVTE